MEILKRCRAAKGDIERLEQRIAQRRDVLGNISAPQADPNGGSRTQGPGDKIPRILAEIDELERQKGVREDEERAEQAAAAALMDMVPILEGRVLFAYYVSRMDTSEIARKEKYTAGYVRKTKRNAEQMLAMISPERADRLLPPWYQREKGGE